MPVKIFARHTAERVRPAIQRGVAHLLTGTASGREQPLALNTELLTLIHPGIKERLELLCQCVAVNELAEAKPLGLDRLARLIKRTAADEILLLEVVHTESAQLRLTPTATHCKRNSASLLMLAAFSQSAKQLVQSFIAPHGLLPDLLHSWIFYFANDGTKVFELVLVIQHICHKVAHGWDSRFQASHPSRRVSVLIDKPALIGRIIPLCNLGEELVVIVGQVPHPKDVDIVIIPGNRFWTALNRPQIIQKVLFQAHIVRVDLTQKLRACDIILFRLSWHQSHLAFFKIVVPRDGVEPPQA